MKTPKFLSMIVKARLTLPPTTSIPLGRFLEAIAVATVVVLAPLMLSAQAPVSSAVKADRIVSQTPNTVETNRSDEIAQKLANPLAAMITRATTADEFHEQLGAAMGTKGPHLIEVQ